MEDKLVIEVPFKDGEKERFLQFVEEEALDMGKYVRKLLMGDVGMKDKFKRLLDRNKANAASLPSDRKEAI